MFCCVGATQGQVQRLERAAAQSAMLGLSTVLWMEFLRGGRPLFHLTLGDAQLLAATALLIVAASACTALMRKRATSGLLLEAVYTSLTCCQRSAASLTQRNTTRSGFDQAVDQVSGCQHSPHVQVFVSL